MAAFEFGPFCAQPTSQLLRNVHCFTVAWQLATTTQYTRWVWRGVNTVHLMCLRSVDGSATLKVRVLGDGLATNMILMSLVLCSSSGSAQEDR